MASGGSDGGPGQPPRRRRGPSPNEEGLRALGSQVGGGSGAPSRSGGGKGSNGGKGGNGGRGADAPAANEKGLRQLGASVDAAQPVGGRRSKRTRRSGKPKWSARRKVLTAAIAVVLLAVLVVGTSWGYLVYRFDQLTKEHISAEQQAQAGQPFNMLVIGSDSRVGEGTAFGSASQVTGQRSDVLMIWHVNPATKSIQVLSIPRDTLVSMVGPNVSSFGTFNRINSSFNGPQGPNLLVETIEKNFGIPINHVVQVDFAGFQGAVNALGGVYLDFNYPARDAYSGLDITTPGCQLLNGTQALAVARSRHYEYYADGYWQSDGSSDFGRIHRQDAFLKALIKAAESKVNPATINAFIGSLHEGIVIDDQWTATGLLGLALDFHSFDPSALQTQTLPTMSNGYVSPWGDVLFVDQPAAQQMLTSIFGNQLTEPTSPPPNTSLEQVPPPVVTTTTAPPPPAGGSSSTTAPPTTTTTVPSFDPTACSG